MSAPTPAPPTRDDPPRPPWGLGEVGIAAVVTLFATTILGSSIRAAAGLEPEEEASLVIDALTTATLWVGMLGSILVVLRLRGGRLVRDLGACVKLTDLPLGIAVGVASQLLLVPAVSWPWAVTLRRTLDELDGPACDFARKADDPVGVVLFVLIVVVGAPIVEELFFRGFVQRAFVARLGRPVGIGVTAVLFGLTHYQLLQLPALIAFGLVLGLLADRTGRLGPNIVTHMAFNATTVVSLLILSTSVDERCADVVGALVR